MILYLSVVLFYLSDCSLFESVNPSFYNIIIRSIRDRYHTRFYIIDRNQQRKKKYRDFVGFEIIFEHVSFTWFNCQQWIQEKSW